MWHLRYLEKEEVSGRCHVDMGKLARLANASHTCAAIFSLAVYQSNNPGNSKIGAE